MLLAAEERPCLSVCLSAQAAVLAVSCCRNWVGNHPGGCWAALAPGWRTNGV